MATHGEFGDLDLHDEPFDVEVRESHVAYNGRVWDVREDHLVYNGSELIRHYVDHTGAVAIVALDDHDRILMIQHYRHPIRTPDWELPAGLLDVPGEDLIEAAKRELAEEVDLEAEHWEKLAHMAPTPGGSDEIIHIFLARGLTDTAEEFERGGEEADIVSLWVPIEEAVGAVAGGRLSNGALMLGVMLAAEKLRRDRA